MSKSDFKSKDLKKIDADLYEFINDVAIPGYQFKKGGAIRFEQPEKADLLKITNFISKKINNPKPQLLFFHLDSSALSSYSIEEMRELIKEMKP